MTDLELTGKLEMLRAQGVAEFSCPDFQVKFSERAYRRSPLIDNSPQPDMPTASKREEVKAADEDLLFHSTPFGGG